MKKAKSLSTTNLENALRARNLKTTLKKSRPPPTPTNPSPTQGNKSQATAKK